MKRLKGLMRKERSGETQTRRKSSSTTQSSEASITLTETAVNTLDATIQLIQQVADLIPIDLAKSVLKGINSILLLIQKYIQNRLDLTGLCQTCKDIGLTLEQAMDGVSMAQLSGVVRDALDVLSFSINELHSRVKKALEHGRTRRMVGATLDQKAISDWTGELDQIRRSFDTKVNIVTAIRLDQIYHILQHPEIKILIPEPPPAPPAFFFGRERLFSEVKGALLSDEDVALIGPGGIGKSTLAKALINDEDIQKRYGRRCFVSYDGMDPTTMTAGSFIDRVASVLGLPTRGVEGKSHVISNLASSPVFIVLDNAETFEDAANPDAAGEIASVVANIANTQGVTMMLTSRTSHSARDACWTEFIVQPLERLPARQCFRKIYCGDVTDDDVDELLAAFDFHPLSIHILAFAARENRWTGNELLERLKSQPSRLLQRGRRKENLGSSIRLSLSSPSIQDLGDDGMNVLGVIAFFPQGVNLNRISRLFPSIPNIMLILDTLCGFSLVYRTDIFITSLAPIRLFLLEEFPTAGLGLLDDICCTYYESLGELSKEKDSHANLVMSDHRNIEHLLMYDIKSSPGSLRETTHTCCQFLNGLTWHKLRPTPLAPIISSLPEGSDPEKDSKAWCLFALGELYFELSNYGTAVIFDLAASVLFIAVGNHRMASRCTCDVAMDNNNQAYYFRARQLLEDLLQSPSWQCVQEEGMVGGVHYALDFAKMHMSRDGADRLFLRSVDHSHCGLSSHVRHWQARMFYGYSTPEEVERILEPLRSRCMLSSEVWDRWIFLETMAQAAFLRRRYDVTMELLNHAHDAVGGNFRLTLIVLHNRAAVASLQGNHDLTRSLLQHTLGALNMVATPLSTNFLLMRYVHGRNELYAKNYSEARRLLTDVIVDCDVQGTIRSKMLCTRTLGELEIFLGCKADSDRYFAQTVELCREAGVPPELLAICDPILRLDDDKFPGWRSFLQAR